MINRRILTRAIAEQVDISCDRMIREPNRHSELSNWPSMSYLPALVII